MDWVLLRDGEESGSDSDYGGSSVRVANDSASEDGSDSGFAIVRVRKGRAAAAAVSPVPAPAVMAAVPSPTPPGFFKVVSYGEAFSASSSSSTGAGLEHSDLLDETTIREALFGAAAGCSRGAAGINDGDTVAHEEDCESDTGEHDGTGGSVEAPPTSSVVGTTASPCNTLPAMATGMEEEDAESSGDDEEEAEEIESSGNEEYTENSSEEEDMECACNDEEDGTENSGEDENGDDDSECSGEEEDMENFSEEDDDDEGSGKEGEDMDNSCGCSLCGCEEDEDEDNESSSEDSEEDDDDDDDKDDKSSDEDDDYNEGSDEEDDTETSGEEEEEDYDDDDDESSGEEEAEDMESSGNKEYTENSGEEEDMECSCNDEEAKEGTENSGEEDMENSGEEDEGDESSSEEEDSECETSSGEEEDDDESSGEDDYDDSSCEDDVDDDESSSEDSEISGEEEECSDGESSSEDCFPIPVTRHSTDPVLEATASSDANSNVKPPGGTYDVDDGSDDDIVPSSAMCTRSTDQAIAIEVLLQEETSGYFFPHKYDFIDTDTDSSDMEDGSSGDEEEEEEIDIDRGDEEEIDNVPGVCGLCGHTVQTSNRPVELGSISDYDCFDPETVVRPAKVICKNGKAICIVYDDDDDVEQGVCNPRPPEATGPSAGAEEHVEPVRRSYDEIDADTEDGRGEVYGGHNAVEEAAEDTLEVEDLLLKLADDFLESAREEMRRRTASSVVRAASQQAARRVVAGSGAPPAHAQERSGQRGAGSPTIDFTSWVMIFLAAYLAIVC